MYILHPPSKIAWIFLVLFVQIGTFQWVTGNPNKKFRFPSRPSVRPASRRSTLSFIRSPLAGSRRRDPFFDPTEVYEGVSGQASFCSLQPRWSRKRSLFDNGLSATWSNSAALEDRPVVDARRNVASHRVWVKASSRGPAGLTREDAAIQSRLSLHPLDGFAREGVERRAFFRTPYGSQ